MSFDVNLNDRLDDAIKCQEEVVEQLELKGDDLQEMLADAVQHLQMLEQHRQDGKLVSETLGADPRQFGRVISD
jgi:hypothetical protein